MPTWVCVCVSVCVLNVWKMHLHWVYNNIQATIKLQKTNKKNNTKLGSAHRLLNWICLYRWSWAFTACFPAFKNDPHFFPFLLFFKKMLCLLPLSSSTTSSPLACAKRFLRTWPPRFLSAAEKARRWRTRLADNAPLNKHALQCTWSSAVRWAHN